MVLNKICDILGIKVNEPWIGKYDDTYKLDNYGRLYVWDDAKMEWKWVIDDLSLLITGKIKPKSII